MVALLTEFPIDASVVFSVSASLLTSTVVAEAWTVNLKLIVAGWFTRRSACLDCGLKPEPLAVTRYVPGGICWNWYSPLPVAVWLDLRLVDLFSLVTAAPGARTPEGPGIAPPNEVNDACDQAMPQQPITKNRDANDCRKGCMGTTS